MKKFISLMCIVFLSISMITNCFAVNITDNPNDTKDSIILRTWAYTTIVNNEVAPIDPQNFYVIPYIKNGRVMVPLRFIVEKFNLSVNYNDKKQEILIDNNIKLNIGKCEMYVNNNMTWLDSAPEISNGRTFIPLRAICEVINKKVIYDQEVIIISNDEINNATKTKIISFALNNLKAPPSEEEIFKSNCINMPYREFEKKYLVMKGTNIQITGKIFDIIEIPINGEIHTAIDVNIGNSSNFSHVFVLYKGQTNFNNRQRITIYGTIAGNTSDFGLYGGFGNSAPFVKAIYFN